MTQEENKWLKKWKKTHWIRQLDEIALTLWFMGVLHLVIMIFLLERWITLGYYSLLVGWILFLFCSSICICLGFIIQNEDMIKWK